MKSSTKNVFVITILCIISLIAGAILSGFNIPNFDSSTLVLVMMVGGGFGTFIIPVTYLLRIYWED